MIIWHQKSGKGKFYHSNCYLFVDATLGYIVVWANSLNEARLVMKGRDVVPKGKIDYDKFEAQLKEQCR
jgi:hypothetical protein